MNKNNIFKTLMEACNYYNNLFNDYNLSCTISSKDFYVTEESALVICDAIENNDDNNYSISIVITDRKIFNKLLLLLNNKEIELILICKNGTDISIYDAERDIIIYNYNCMYEEFLKTIDPNDFPNKKVSFTNTDTESFELYTHTLKLQKLLALKYEGYCSNESENKLYKYIRTITNILG